MCPFTFYTLNKKCSRWEILKCCSLRRFEMKHCLLETHYHQTHVVCYEQIQHRVIVLDNLGGPEEVKWSSYTLKVGKLTNLKKMIVALCAFLTIISWHLRFHFQPEVGQTRGRATEPAGGSDWFDVRKPSPQLWQVEGVWEGEQEHQVTWVIIAVFLSVTLLMNRGLQSYSGRLRGWLWNNPGIAFILVDNI